MSIWAGYRLAPQGKPQVRPPWFDQAACLRSFAAAIDVARANGFELDTHYFIDGRVDQSIMNIVDALGTTHFTASHGNSPTAREVFAAALDSKRPYLLFAEDDYLWTSTAVLEVLRVLETYPDVGYATPYQIERDPTSRRGHSSYLVNGTRWRSAEQTTMTFATRRSVLQRDLHAWKLATYGRSPKDIYAFPAILRGQWFRLVGNAAARDPSRIANIETLRLIGRCIRTRLRPRLRSVLAVPEQSLATHVHLPYISRGVDWQQLSQSFES